MHDWFFRHGARRRLIDWLGIDAWIDSSLAQSWQSVQERWNAVSSFFARFRLTGWKRLLNEAIGEKPAAPSMPVEPDVSSRLRQRPNKPGRGILGFDRVYLHNVGRNQVEWIEVFGKQVLPKLH